MAGVAQKTGCGPTFGWCLNGRQHEAPFRGPQSPRVGHEDPSASALRAQARWRHFFVKGLGVPESPTPDQAPSLRRRAREAQALVQFPLELSHPLSSSEQIKALEVGRMQPSRSPGRCGYIYIYMCLCVRAAGEFTSRPARACSQEYLCMNDRTEMGSGVL